MATPGPPSDSFPSRAPAPGQAAPAVLDDPETQELEQAVMAPGDAPRVGLVVDTEEHAPALEPAERTLDDHGVAFEVRVASEQDGSSTVQSYAGNAQMRGLRVLVVAAGAPLTLPAAVADASGLPVVGVALDGATAEAEPGTPVAFVGPGDLVAAALLAVRIVDGAAPGGGPGTDIATDDDPGAGGPRPS